MIYPTLTLPRCERLAEKKIEGQDPNVEEDWMGRGDALDLKPLKVVASSFEDKISEVDPDVDRDQVEGQLASELHRVLSNLPVKVLDNPGFWRYLNIKHFWEFIAWREREAFERGNHMKYLNGRSNTEAVLVRMYLRAKSVGSDDLELAHELEQAADFWRSHILRVRVGSAPALTRTYVRLQKEDRLMTQRLRDFAKSVNRTWSNIQLHLYDESEAEDLLNEIRSRNDQ